MFRRVSTLVLSSPKLLRRTNDCRTMIWAIDLDDGTLIDALGKGLGRPKIPDLGPEPPYIPCFGAQGWPALPNSTSI